MLDLFIADRWSPYAVGAGIGILVCTSFLLADHPLGCSTAYVKIRGLIDRTFRRNAVDRNEYYQLFIPVIDWQVMILPGIIIGAYLSTLLSAHTVITWVPDLFASVFGLFVWFRIVVAFTGGVILIIGARWAGGCMCGHGISGITQLSLASLITTLSVFIGGIITAFIIFRLAGGLGGI